MAADDLDHLRHGLLWRLKANQHLAVIVAAIDRTMASAFLVETKLMRRRSAARF
jgi:hypothetical protein